MSDLVPQDASDDDDPFSELWEQLSKRTEKFGLYARDFAVGSMDSQGQMTPPTKESLLDDIKEGKGVVVMSSFIVGDLAWDDKVQDPAKFENDKEFRNIVPDVAKDLKAQLEEKLKRGEDPFED